MRRCVERVWGVEDGGEYVKAQLSVEYTPWVFFPTADYSGSWFSGFDQCVSRGWTGGCALLGQAGSWGAGGGGF